MKSEFTYNISEMYRAMNEIKNAGKQYKTSVDKINNILSQELPEKWKGNAMQELLEAFGELSDEFSDVPGIIDTYVKTLQDFSIDFAWLDDKHKEKISLL